jgi:heat shock transcription factor
MQQQGYNASTQPDMMRWSQGAEHMGYPDPAAGYNMNTYGGNTAMSQAQYDQSMGAPSTQLARRPINRQQLVPAGQRMAQDQSGDWSQFGDDALLDPQGGNGSMEENNNIELLEERAAVAKREATSKRKPIPPFVQKLSR